MYMEEETPCVYPRLPVPEDFIKPVASTSSQYTGVNQQLQAIAPHVHFMPLSINALAPSGKGRPFPEITLLVKAPDTETTYKVNALLDSGASSLYVDEGFVERHHLNTRPLLEPLRALNANGTTNRIITHEVQFQFTVQGHTSKEWFLVADLGGKPFIIGMDWFRDHNPEFDWRKGEIKFTRCPPKCGGINKLQNSEVIDETSIPNERDELINEIRQQICAYEAHATRIATDAMKAKTVQTLDDIIRGPYGDFVDVFSDVGYQDLPPRRHWDNNIEFVPDWKDKKWKTRIYPLNPVEQVELDKFLQENLANGRIRPSKSEISSPIFFVSKKGGDLRPVVDYRKVNDITVKNAYPLPLISELVDKWKGCKYFTKLDIRAGYYNIRMKEGDEWKTAFATNRGLFEYLVMPFGLANAPATFQTMMNDIFRVYVRRGDTGVYIDDVIIATKSDPTGKLSDKAYHEKCVREILEVFRTQKLYLKPEKCEFSQRQVDYLGFVISGDHVTMDPAKVDGVASWNTPTNLKQLRSFIGFINFYRRFIDDFSGIARPLNDLTKKDTPWTWKEEQQKAFDKLKEKLCTAPVLVHPDSSKPFMVETDASNYAYGAILSQEQANGKWHPVAYLSKSMTPAERNYTIYDKELLAIVKAFKEWRQFLYGNPHTIQVLTDHANLRYFRTAQDLNSRQARWATTLEQYNYTFTYRPGTQSGKPDALSRRSDHDDGSNDNKQRILLPDTLFEKVDINILELHSKFDQEIHQAQLRDPLVQDLQQKRESDMIDGWDWEEGLWRYQGKVYVPENLRRSVFDAHHSSPLAGHPGQKPTLEHIGRNYYWPNMKTDIFERVKNCDICQRIKTQTSKPAGQLKPNEIPTKPWEIVSMDLIVGLPESAGYDSILVVVDRFSKWVVLVACDSTLDSLGLAKLLRDHIWTKFGIPRLIISDRGPQFASKFTKELAKELGIELGLSTAYHPQTDGQTERMNQEIEKYLRAYVNYHQNDWKEWLSTCQFAMNNTTKSSTGFTPFELNFGRHPNTGIVPKQSTSDMPAVEDFVKGLAKSQETARKALEKTAEAMKKFADQKRGPTPEFQEGDLVMLSAKNLRTDRPSAKLADKWEGPFKILKKVSSHSYRLELPDEWKIHNTFHVDKLRPYSQDPKHPNHPKPPPVLINDEEEYEVDKVIDSSYRRGILYYRVTWVGYPLSEATWIRADQTDNMKEVLDKWHKAHPDAPRTLRPEKPKTKGKGKTPAKKIRVLGTTTELTIDEEINWKPKKIFTNVESWPGTLKLPT